MATNMKIERIGILGLGLIGGSLARAFRYKAGVREIVAMDMDEAAGAASMADGVVTAFATPDADYDIFDGCDLLILGVPVAVIVEVLPKLANLRIGIISDVSSVKVPVMNLPLPGNFIGGHPMAGSERQGYACSRETLFENAVYVLCVGEDCTVPAALLQSFEDLISAIGASPVRMDADKHDARVAAISHLPHVAATALSLLAAQQKDDFLTVLAAGGFRDITRIASSDPELWAGITEASGPALLPVLDEYITILKKIRADIDATDRKAMHAFFAQGAFYRNHLPTGGRGALEAPSSLTVYLEDRPGSIAEITAILGRNNINIRNMNIRNYRSYEGGQLLLLLGDSSQAGQAYSLLKEAGYECD